MVSIHAPARGATRAFSIWSTYYKGVSIHAPARGATIAYLQSIRSIRGFNSRSREGSDGSRPPCRGCPRRFNSRSREGSDIHQSKQSNKQDRFNSRSREGSDCILIRWRFSYQKFQFTLPRGERQRVVESPLRFTIRFNSRSREGSDVATSRTSFVISGFNSRSREGSDAKFLIATVNTCGFNSRSREGSDKERDGQLMELVQFQFTLPRGERLFAATGDDVNLTIVSIHAPARGATELGDIFEPLTLVSIHAPARGATSVCIINTAKVCMFQFTLPRGERLSRQKYN